MRMLPRERVIAAVEGKPTDRVPHHFRAWGNVLDQTRKHTGLPDHEAVLQWAHSDLRDLGGYGEYLKEGVCAPDSDLWGVKRRTVTGPDGVSYPHIVFAPLAAAQTMDDLRKYRFPKAAEVCDFSRLHARAKAAEGYFTILEAESVFDRTWALRGMESFMMDLMAGEDMADYMLAQNARFFLDRTRMLLEAGKGLVDCIAIYNDFGTQNGLMVSVETYRRFVKPHQRTLIALAHEFGARVFYHSCGCVSELYGDLLEIGLDIIDPLQFPALQCTPEQLRARFPTACFHGGLDTQHILPLGTPEQIRAEVTHLQAALGQHGRYVLSTSHNIQGGVPFANLQAMVEAAGN